MIRTVVVCFQCFRWYELAVLRVDVEVIEGLGESGSAEFRGIYHFSDKNINELTRLNKSFRAAVPFWRKVTKTLTGLSTKRGCSPLEG